VSDFIDIIRKAFASKSVVPAVPNLPPIVAGTIDQRLLDFPFYSYVDDHFKQYCVDSLIQKYCFIENIDYVRVEETGQFSFSYRTLCQIRFKDKRYVTEIENESMHLRYVSHSITEYIKKDADDSFYAHALHIAKEGKMTASINFFPKIDKMPSIIQEIVSFYVANGYNLPHDAATFKAKYLVACDEYGNGGRGFFVYLKSEEDAASLLLQLSDLIDIL
jgi:hypothetical protein